MARKSKIQLMPPDVRKWLEKTLVDRGFSGYKELESLMKDKGLNISHASIHRHGQKLERKLAALKASTEAAKLIAESAPDDADHRSAAVISLVQTELFEALLNLQEAEDDSVGASERVKLLSNAARAIAQASQASVNQKKWENEVRQKLDALEKESGSGKKTLDAQTLKIVRETLYGG
jgi:predicted phage tail protein